MSEATQRQRGQMPAWLVFSGVGISVVGASAIKHAENLGELVGALGGGTDRSEVAMAVAPLRRGVACHWRCHGRLGR
jgi:hypothetical protein